jgi:hypothetical protein
MHKYRVLVKLGSCRREKADSSLYDQTTVGWLSETGADPTGCQGSS